MPAGPAPTSTDCHEPVICTSDPDRAPCASFAREDPQTALAVRRARRSRPSANDRRPPAEVSTEDSGVVTDDRRVGGVVRHQVIWRLPRLQCSGFRPVAPMRVWFRAFNPTISGRPLQGSTRADARPSHSGASETSDLDAVQTICSTQCMRDTQLLPSRPTPEREKLRQPERRDGTARTQYPALEPASSGGQVSGPLGLIIARYSIEQIDERLTLGGVPLRNRTVDLLLTI
jgi:hypothetical protein